MTTPLRSVPMEREMESEEKIPGLGRPLRRIVMGPDHPVCRGAFSLILDLDGETVVSASVEIGLGHRGVEKEMESRPWYQALPYAERIAPQSGSLPATALCRAVECLLEIDLPERAEWLRVLVGEISRVGDHLVRLASTCQGLGAQTQAAWLWAAREFTLGWLDLLTGARLMPHFVRLGGVSHAPPATLAACIRDEVAPIEALIADVDITLVRTRPFIDRLRGTAVLGREACIHHGLTGVLLRAAGTPSDLRKEAGHSVYPEIDFDVVVGSVGDNYDRFLVCLEEIRQSLRIVLQCVDRLEMLGPGPIRSDDRRLGWPDKARVIVGHAEMIHHSMGVTDGPEVPAGEAYAAVESANGELGFYLVSDGGPVPVRIHCRAPSFFHARMLPSMLLGLRLSDLPSTLDLANVTSTECDR